MAERGMSFRGREVGVFGTVASSVTLAWLASHRDRLCTLLLGGHRLSVLVIWDRRGAERVDRSDGDIAAIYQLAHDKPYPNPPFTEPTDVPDEPVAERSGSSIPIPAQKKVVAFQTLEVSTTPGVKHLEHWPAGLSLCGIDLFPEDRDLRPGFSRAGGRSNWNEPCAECVRRARRYTYSREVTVSGLGDREFRAALGLGDQS